MPTLEELRAARDAALFDDDTEEPARDAAARIARCEDDYREAEYAWEEALDQLRQQAVLTIAERRERQHTYANARRALLIPQVGDYVLIRCGRRGPGVVDKLAPFFDTRCCVLGYAAHGGVWLRAQDGRDLPRPVPLSRLRLLHRDARPEDDQVVVEEADA